MQDTHYKKLILKAPFAYAYHKILLDSNGKPYDYEFIEVNEAFEKMTGLSANLIINNSILNLLPDIVKDEFDWINFYGDVAINGGDKEFEQFSQPLQKWYQVQVYSPEKYYFSTVFIDISSEKDKTKELEGFFSINLDLLCVTNLQGRFIKVSKEWENVLGFSVSELENEYFIDFVHPDDVSKSLEVLSDVENQQTISNFINRYRRKDGTYRHIEWRSKSNGNQIYSAARDITEQIQMTAALKESEEKYRVLFTDSSDAYLIIENGIIIECNKSAEEMFGMYQNQIIGLSPDMISPTLQPDGRASKESAELKISEALTKGKILFEWCHKKNDGSEFSVEVILIPMNLNDKTLLFASCRDITSRKKAEQLLIENDLLLKKLSKHLPGVIYKYQLKPDGKAYMLFASENIWDVYEYTANEVAEDASIMLGRIHEDDFEYVQNKYYNSYNSLTTWEADYRVVLPIKGIRWLRGIAKPELQEDKSVIWHGYIADVTDKKLAEFELKNTKEQYMLAVNGSNDGIWDWDMLTNKLFISAKWKEMIGYEENELENDFKSFEENLHPDDKDSVFKLLHDYLNFKTPAYQAEFRFKHKNGSYIWVFARGSVLRDEYGKPYRMAGSHSDITDRKEAEQQLHRFARDIEWSNWELENEIETRKLTENLLQIAVDDAKNANKTKSEFLANMSHEIRTPMNSILGFSEIMLNSTNNEKYKGYLKTILRSGKTLLSLINDILDLSKIEAGKLIVSYEQFDVNSTIKEIYNLFEHKVSEKGLQLLLDIDERLPNSINFDELRLKQILLNLVGNAVKFTHTGYVKISIVIDEINENKIDFSLKISDTGIGINEEEKDLIFESFRQQSGQDNKQYGGTGLGLAITKKLVELMGGEILLDSKPGIGSVFSAVFKNVEFSQNISNKDIQYEWLEEIEFAESKVLIVDDTYENRQLIVSYLEGQNLEIYEAQSGLEAVELSKKIIPDIIIMDIRMPGIDGDKAAEIIKSNNMTCNIPILAFTASAENFESAEKNKIFDGYLRKPVQKNDLYAELKKFIKFTAKSIDNSKHYIDSNDSAVLQLNENLTDEIKLIFKKDFAPEIEELLLFMNPDNIEEFVIRLKQFSEQYSLDYVSNLSSRLLIDLSCYDYEKIEQSINEINNIFAVK